ncbi:unnamed protein product, partial [Porites evermanni]
AFGYDINNCLFSHWTPFKVVEKGNAVLQKQVACGGKQLCYGTPPNPNNTPEQQKFHKAQFAVCYNTATRIPTFTGHVVKPGVVRGIRPMNRMQPSNEIALHGDYNTDHQRNLNINFDIVNRYCARGHLTPNADFSDGDERARTYVTTNIALACLFNGGNWQILETIIRGYANFSENHLFVITGTSGSARNLNGAVVWLNNRVLAPGYYWKAVCDPINKQSIFFFAENNVGNVDNVQEKGCFNIKQTKRYGVIKCDSISNAEAKFGKLPDFHKTNCKPDEGGSKFKEYVMTNNKYKMFM